jgi:hypothetical protein
MPWRKGRNAPKSWTLHSLVHLDASNRETDRAMDPIGRLQLWEQNPQLMGVVRQLRAVKTRSVSHSGLVPNREQLHVPRRMTPPLQPP